MKSCFVKEQALTDLEFFALRYFAHYFQQKSPDFHKEIYDLLQSDEVRRLAIAAPRGHAKSTIVALIYVLWVALTNKKRFIVLISDTATQADALLKSIKTEIEDNDLLFQDFGNQEADYRWTQSDIILMNGCRIISRGAGSKIRGIRERSYRPDLLVIDDLENDEHVRSKLQRDKLKEWYAKAASNLVDPQLGKIVVIGTLLHPYALMTELVSPDKWKTYIKRRYMAVTDESTLWPERFDMEILDSIKKEIGSFAFQCEYMNDPVDIETKMFRIEWLQYFDMPPKGLETIAAIDPALSTKTSADFFTCATIGLDRKTGNIFLLDMYRKRSALDRHISEIIAMYQRWNWSKLYVETVAFQEVLKKHIAEKAAAQGVYLPTKSLKNHGDKLLRIQNLQPLFENGRIHIRRNQSDFIEEYDMYPNVDHDDQLDALEMAVRMLTKQTARIRTL